MNRLRTSTVSALESLSSTATIALRAPVAAQSSSHTPHTFVISLDQAIESFVHEHEEVLIRTTTPQRWCERMLLQTVIEAAAMTAEYMIDLEEKDKKLCPVSKRISSMTSLNKEQREHLIKSIGISTARIASNLLWMNFLHEAQAPTFSA